jgi:4a-hydroxytetrahydrobiopterin dehydratase
MNELAQMQIRQITENSSQLTDHEARQILTKLPGWYTTEKDAIPRLEKVFEFETYDQAIAFTNRVAQAAAQENHHPAILTEWKKVTVTWWTHRIKGLHQNDFIMAAKTEQFYG